MAAALSRLLWPTLDTAVPGGASSHGDADKCFIRHPDLGFIQNYTIIQGDWWTQGDTGHCLWGEKAVFFTDARNNMLKGTARYIMNVMHRT